MNNIIQNLLDQLTPYLRNIQISASNDFLPVFEVVFPNNWVLPNNGEFVPFPIENGDTYKVYRYHVDEGKIADELVSYLLGIINLNDALENKRLELEENIKKQQELFQKQMEELKESFFVKKVDTEEKVNILNFTEKEIKENLSEQIEESELEK